MYSEDELDEFLKAAKDAAQAAAVVLRKYWGKLTFIEEKNHSGNLVTEADREAEELIVDILHERYPEHTILAEESGKRFASSSKGYVWAVDPLDGTTNYTHQFPMVSISIGLIYRDKPIVGVVYNPIFEELFWATKGRGAYLNGHKLAVSKVDALSYGLLATGFAYDRRENADNNYAEFCRLTELSQGVRRMGSAALDLAYIAAGRFDGYWERGLQPWDVAAGVVLVEEAGGIVSGYSGDPFQLYSGRILASNSVLHSVLSQALQDA